MGIAGARIAAVDRLDGAAARQTVDAGGRVVAPGFVDIHSHADWSLLVDPRAESAVRQGVTTMMLGNCGHAPAPLRRAEDARHLVLGYVESAEVRADWRDVGGLPRRARGPASCHQRRHAGRPQRGARRSAGLRAASRTAGCDVVVFDPETIRDATTMARPDEFPPGVALTVVNGQVVFDGQHLTGSRPGSVLRRS